MTLTFRNHRMEHRWIPGDAAAPTLVFLHEGLGSVSLWRDFPDRLAAATGCPALVYSRLGYGRSDPGAASFGMDYLHHEALVVLPAVLDQLGVHEPILVGHSDGASIALIHAARARRAVRGVIVEAPHVFIEELTLAGIRAATRVWETSDLKDRMGQHHKDPDHTFRRWADAWLAPGFAAWTIEEMLPAITAPVLAIQGDGDEYGTPAQIETVAAGVSGPGEARLLPDCKHTPHREQTDRVLGMMADFVRRAAAGSAAARA